MDSNQNHRVGYVGPYGHAETRIFYLLAQADEKDTPTQCQEFEASRECI